MPSPTKGPRLGGGPAHERLMLANLATSLFEHNRITTTETKAKRLRPVAERLITFAKRGDQHARRRVMRTVRDKGVVHKLFTQIAEEMRERPGGYTRIVKVGPRKGDNAPMAVIELVQEPFSPKKATVKEAEAATRRSAATASDAPADATPDASADATPDAPAEATPDAPADDTPDAGTDATADAGTDAGAGTGPQEADVVVADAGVEAPVEATPGAASDVAETDER